MNVWMVIWLAVAAIMIIAEIISLGLTSIWFAGGALVAALIAQLGGHWALQLIAFAGVSVVLLVFTRPFFAKHVMKEPEKTNVESLIGEKAVVKERIDNLKSEGVAMVNGLEWSARSADDSVIDAGATVEIVEVKGVKLIVKTL
jgi:membrane protein implicated in regulation of membrane protease activity